MGSTAGPRGRRSSVSEEAVVHAWLARIASRPDLTTREGERVTILDAGRRNPHDGPDFLDAVVQIAGREQRGAVEIHTRSADWERHGHRHSSRYRQVVLHVAMRDDGGRDLPPTVILGPREGSRAWQEPSRLGPPCGSLVDDCPPALFEPALVLAACERLSVHCERLRALTSGLPPLRARHRLFHGLLRALGYGGNQALWEALARALPFSDWMVLADRTPAEREARIRGLLEERADLRHSKGIRPGNRPDARLIWLVDMLPRLVTAEGEESIRRAVLVGTAEGYATTLGQALLGADRIREMLHTVVAPWALVTGAEEGHPALLRAGLRIFFASDQTPTYATLRMWPTTSCGGGAWVTQALLHWKREYCEKGGCETCVVGRFRNE